jgi:hypothetical protein
MSFIYCLHLSVDSAIVMPKSAGSTSQCRFYGEGKKIMLLKFYRYATALVLTTLLTLLLIGCGGGSGGTPGPTATPAPTATPGPTATPAPTATPGPTATPAPTATPNGGAFTITGKIALADGTPITAGTTVNLYKTSYKIYTTSINGNVFYGTRNANGVESVKIDSVVPVQSVTTSPQGIYNFIGVIGGNYTIQPKSGTYLFKWSLAPSRSDTGVVSITESGMVYLYNPEESGNKLSTDGTLIFNTGDPFSIIGNTTGKFDFEASSGSGGIIIQF